MTTTPPNDHARLQQLADRAELADLLARQGLWLDEHRFDDAAEIFTEDAVAQTQGGTAKGRDALAEQARRAHADYATQSATSGVVIDLDGDRATVRANLVATFVRHDTAPAPTFTVGERYRFDARRTAEGWRFSRVEATPVWRSGTLP